MTTSPPPPVVSAWPIAFNDGVFLFVTKYSTFGKSVVALVDNNGAGTVSFNATEAFTPVVTSGAVVLVPQHTFCAQVVLATKIKATIANKFIILIKEVG